MIVKGKVVGGVCLKDDSRSIYKSLCPGWGHLKQKGRNLTLDSTRLLDRTERRRANPLQPDWHAERLHDKIRPKRQVDCRNGVMGGQVLVLSVGSLQGRQGITLGACRTACTIESRQMHRLDETHLSVRKFDKEIL